ncbi:MAG: autoinducer binding domain-containing protein [Beijerinckiaceae bacterium]|nr:autoinducer binding domain-containing protein [Beijerinckiaceae bacterium]
MLTNSLDNTIRFIHDLDRARNIEDFSSQVVRHLSQIGAEHVIAGTFPAGGPNRRKQLSHALFGNWPGEWLERYLSRGYILKDPVILRSKSDPSPFFWGELTPFLATNIEGRRIVEEGREFNLTNGFSAGIRTLDGEMVGFSISGRDFEADPDMRGVLSLIASYAVGRAIALQQESSHQNNEIRLSKREREALQWAAEGKADWEIGEIMSISEHGADKHMRSVRAKLGAMNRTQAVAEAIRRGLIA